MNINLLSKTVSQLCHSGMQFSEELSHKYNASIFVGDCDGDKMFCGSIPSLGRVIVVGSGIVGTDAEMGAVFHELGHLDDPEAAIPDYLLTTEDCDNSHRHTKAMAYEVAADWYAVKHGAAVSLLKLFAIGKARCQKAKILVNDYDDRIERVTNWIEDGIWVMDGLTKI